MNRGGSSVGAGQAPPTPRNSIESRGKKEGEGGRKEGGRRKGARGRRREMSTPQRANRGSATAYEGNFNSTTVQSS